jgi:hypothetical protein
VCEACDGKPASDTAQCGDDDVDDRSGPGREMALSGLVPGQC